MAAVAFVRFATRSGDSDVSTESIVLPICQSRCSFHIVPPLGHSIPRPVRRKSLALETPQQLARQTIDALLTAAGWALQDRDQFDRNAALGVAVREFPLLAGPCDYLLFIDGRAAGVIETKKRGSTLSGVAEHSEKYMLHLPEHLARWDDLLVYDYESTGEETLFRDLRDAIGSQLVEKYLVTENRSTGCLLVTLAKDRAWEHPDSGTRIDLSGLKTLLCDEAARIRDSMGRAVTLAVHILDLREPSSGDSKNRSGP